MTDPHVPFGTQPDPRPKLSTLNIVFQPQFVTGEGPHDLVFVEVHDDEGKSINVGTWAADGDYEQLTLTADDFAPRDPLRDVHQVVISTPLPEGDALRKAFLEPGAKLLLRSDKSRWPCPATDDQIKHMVDRFLGWRLPDGFLPDGGISFERIANPGTTYEHVRQPSGTNLLAWAQAKAMVEYMIEGLPAAHTEMLEALHDFTTHRAAWRGIISESIANSDEPEQTAYEEHELRAFDYAMTMLDLHLGLTTAVPPKPLFVEEALASFWVPVSPTGEPDMTRLCALKADCKITADESKLGWRIADVDLTETKRA